jgi:hypothetical protein
VQWTVVIGTLVAGVGGLLVSALTWYFARSASDASLEARDLARAKFIEAAAALPPSEGSIVTSNLDDLVESAVSSGSTGRSLDDGISKAVEDRIADLVERLRRVEAQVEVSTTLAARNPDPTRRARIIDALRSSSTDDSFAIAQSIQLAVLGTRLEAAQEAIKRLQDEKHITKWDVAVVVFAVLGALGVIAGIVTGVLAIVVKP